MNKFLIITFILLATIPQLIAQDTITFRRSRSSDVVRISELNIIKINPTSILLGVIPLYYERRINKSLGVEVAIGISLERYYFDLFNFPIDEEKRTSKIKFENNQKPVLGKYFSPDDQYIKETIGPYFSFLFRLYMDNDGIQGTYFGLGYSFLQFRSKVQKATLTQNNEIVYTEDNKINKKNNNSILFAIGYQHLFRRLAMDVTLGLASVNYRESEYIFGFNSDLNLIEGKKVNDYYIFGYNIQVKLGYIF